MTMYGSQTILESSQAPPNNCLRSVHCHYRSLYLIYYCVSQYIKNTSTSSYEEDDRQFLAGFLDIITDYKVEYDQVQLPAKVPEVTVNLRFSELNSLYNIAGYLLRSIKNTTKTCSQCVNSAGSTTPIYTQLLA
jgi:hypothetical protein